MRIGVVGLKAVVVVRRVVGVGREWRRMERGLVRVRRRARGGAVVSGRSIVVGVGEGCVCLCGSGWRG